MAKLHEITQWYDSYLKVQSIPDYPNAHNGLQVENNGTVQRIASAVDASLDSIQQAADQNIDLLIVHHGLFWQGVEMLKGSWRKKCQILLENNIAVYSSHIPLDIHPEIGNSTLLAKKIGLRNIQSCIPWKGVHLGITGEINAHRDELVAKIAEVTNNHPFSCLKGQEQIKDLLVISGGAGSQIKEVYSQGHRNFLTGESSQWTIPYAEDNEMNLILGGHYHTETFGVDALAALTIEKFPDLEHATIRSSNQL